MTDMDNSDHKETFGMSEECGVQVLHHKETVDYSEKCGAAPVNSPPSCQATPSVTSLKAGASSTPQHRDTTALQHNYAANIDSGKYRSCLWNCFWYPLFALTITTGMTSEFFNTIVLVHTAAFY